jgi:hypothetical protein
MVLSNAERQARYRQRLKDAASASIAVIGANLRNATEDDVAAALAGSYIAEDLAQVEPAALLEFWNRMLDQFIGERGD